MSALSHNSPLKRWPAQPEFWFVVALVFRLLYLLEQGGTSPAFHYPMLDEREAVESAVQLLAGTVPPEPYFKAPAYSWIMAAVMWLTGDFWPWTVRLLQHTAGAGLVLIIARMASMLCAGAKCRQLAVGVAGALAAFYGPMIRLENNLSLDFWVVFFQTLALYYMCKSAFVRQWAPRCLLLAGLCLAAAWLTRPTVTLVLPVLAAWALLSFASGSKTLLQRLWECVLMLAPVAAAMVLVVARNSAVGSEPLLMPWQGGYSLYYANSNNANGRYYLQPKNVNGDAPNPTRFLAVQGYLDSLDATQREKFAANPLYSRVDKFWFNKTLDAVGADPGRALRLLSKKYLYLFSDKEIYNYEDYDLQKSLSPALKLAFTRFGLVFPLALVGMVAMLITSRRRRSLHWLLWLYVFSLAGAIALYYSSGRMRMPIAPPLIALAGAAVAQLTRLCLSRKIAASALFTTGLIICWVNWWGVRSESMAHADLARLSNAAWHRQNYEQALDFALWADRLVPGYPVLHRLKAQASYSLGDLEQAEQEFEKSVQLLNDDTSRRNLFIVREELEAAAKAER